MREWDEEGLVVRRVEMGEYAWEKEREMKGELLRSSLKLKMYLFYVINISTSTKTS